MEEVKLAFFVTLVIMITVFPNFASVQSLLTVFLAAFR